MRIIINYYLTQFLSQSEGEVMPESPAVTLLKRLDTEVKAVITKHTDP